MSLDADLATLRALQAAVEYLLAGRAGRRDEILRLLDDAPGAAGRVEAKIARLRQHGDPEMLLDAKMKETHRAEAAEAEVARLREGLRDIAASDATSPESLRSYARALLAEDGAAYPQIGVRWKGDYPHLIGGTPDEDGAP